MSRTPGGEGTAARETMRPQKIPTRYTVRLRPPMEFPLTAPCPQCGSEMEPRSKPRRGRAVYVCPECGFEMEADEEPADEEPTDEEPAKPVDEDDV